MSNIYIKECVSTKRPVTVITINGFQMRGVVVAEDASYIVLLCDGREKLIYKHAISTIST